MLNSSTRSSPLLRTFQTQDTDSANKTAKRTINLIERRQKLIKLADKSEAGWLAVDEYESDELAEDSADEKRIRTHYFRKPKDRPKETKTKGIVYKVKCRSCDFTYIGETKRSWNSRGGEHKPGTNNNKESAIKDHVETTDHDIDTGYVEILEKNVNNWHKRIFLESWHSTIDKNAVNERKPFPSVYKTLLKP